MDHDGDSRDCILRLNLANSVPRGLEQIQQAAKRVAIQGGIRGQCELLSRDPETMDSVLDRRQETEMEDWAV